jgi:hypothetical protein
MGGNSMKGSFKTALIAAIVSAFVAAGAAVATTQAFTLGTTNRVDAPSTVINTKSNGTTNPVDAPLLTLDNRSATANATPLSLLAASGHTPFKVNTQAKVANLNADQLDGRSSEYFLPKTAQAIDSAAVGGYPVGSFYHRELSTTQKTSDCVVTAQLWTQCADVSVTVPAGHLWYVTVLSSVTANPGNAYDEALLCPAYTGPQCVTGSADRMSFEANQYGNWSSSATSAFYAGTYTFNTAMKWPFLLPANGEAFTTTTVIISDYRSSYLTGN